MNTFPHLTACPRTDTHGEAPTGQNAAILAEATALLRRGVLLPAQGQNAINVGFFLIQGLGLEADYLENQVQTLLRNGLAVDDFAAPLAPGDRLALSAAMPGVAGAALRRGGWYAAMRADISQQKTDAACAATAPDAGPIWIELRCFNSIAEDLAGHLLRRGLAARPADVGPSLACLSSPPPAGLALPARDLLWLADSCLSARS